MYRSVHLEFIFRWLQPKGFAIVTAHDAPPHFVSGRSLLSCDHGERIGIWFSIVHSTRGVRITIGHGADGEGLAVESCEPEAVRFIAQLIHQMRAVAA